MALIPPNFLNCVVSIGTRVTNEILWLGTGFIVVTRPVFSYQKKLFVL
jgi:hypothetical protein